jgi:hypothetical protein
MVEVAGNAPVCFSCKDRFGIVTFRDMSMRDCSICGDVNTVCYHARADQEIDWTLYTMGEIEFTRAPADAVCRQCSKPYWQHPFDTRPTTVGRDGRPWLHVLCGGALVKL